MQEELLALVSELEGMEEMNEQPEGENYWLSCLSVCFRECLGSSTTIECFCSYGTSLGLVALYSVVKRKTDVVSRPNKHDTIGTTWSGEVAFCSILLFELFERSEKLSQKDRCFYLLPGQNGTKDISIPSVPQFRSSYTVLSSFYVITTICL